MMEEIMVPFQKRISVTTAQGIMRFAKLERNLAFVCIFTPLFLIIFDSYVEPIRGSISAYYNMGQNQIFYFLLTVAAMLFIVNGVVKEKHIYNVVLGIALAGVLLFNCDDFSLVHNIFAIAFFGGNAVVIVVFSSKKERWFKALLVGIILVTMACWWYFDAFTLFWAEWISLVIIAIHYILESWGVID